jgi:hypothetical protein
LNFRVGEFVLDEDVVEGHDLPQKRILLCSACRYLRLEVRCDGDVDSMHGAAMSWPLDDGLHCAARATLHVLEHTRESRRATHRLDTPMQTPKYN